MCLINIMSQIFLRSLDSIARRTVAIEAAYQNVGIATSVALSMFNGADLSDAMGVPFFYGITEMIIISIYCILAWKSDWTKASPDDSLFTVLTKSYEVSTSLYSTQSENDQSSAQAKRDPDLEHAIKVLELAGTPVPLDSYAIDISAFFPSSRAADEDADMETVAETHFEVESNSVAEEVEIVFAPGSEDGTD